MIHAFGEAIAFMRTRPIVVVGMAIIILLQAGIALLQLPVASYFLSVLDFNTLIDAFGGIQLAGFFILLLIGMIVNFTGFLWVAQHVKAWKLHSGEKTSLQLIKSAGLVAAAIILVGGLMLGLTWVLTAIVDAIGFFALLLLGVMVLLAFYLTIKFLFVLPLMGFGLGLKQALQQSWHITQEHFFASAALLIGLFIVTAVIDFITQTLLVGIDADIIVVPLNFIIAVLLSTYSAAVVACAIPLQEVDTIPHPKHAHGKAK
ncbi:MAG: glycerophosphoryl diester phosphodiesterase membrane domain-containing protein [Candidatus Iainarchaeum archaeon]|uniref:Glycerophosphoryl diester phosphodiesterase membrane domain-containing protein n=1 Tax=Candidatus Iainarchaeum sp. TaxID=3101447 RepID=A0A7T9DIU4_9ARCH|nr:MAG: glycerophosphoryl diester phosphodiesterase membrane domain-containing protein [Candidatus Diapherotrites archaeon]